MRVTFLTDNVIMGRCGVRYPFVVEVPGFGQIAGRVTVTQRGATAVAFPAGVRAIPVVSVIVLSEFEKQVNTE